jgi:hypothetical protein
MEFNKSAGDTTNSEDNKEKKQEKYAGHECHDRKHLGPTGSTLLFSIAIVFD